MTNPPPRRERWLRCRHCDEPLGLLSRRKLVIEPDVKINGEIPGSRLELVCRRCGGRRSVTDIVFEVVVAQRPSTAA